MSAATNSKFGKYVIIDQIGKGGFATVFRAKDITLERDVALKILLPQLMNDSLFVLGFQQEARTLAAMQHPAIITIFEASEYEGRLYIAMDLVDGPSLAGLIATQGPLTWPDGLVVLKPVFDALEYAHSRQIVHRDLKPSNILIDKRRGMLLSDFGFARLLGQSSMSLSSSGGILGTPSYIAPEVWDSDAATPQSDIYSLGCIVYEAFTGRVLFDGPTPIQIMRAHDRGPQYPQTWLNGVPAELSDVLQKALARNPATRYQSASAFWYALHELDVAMQRAREAAEMAAQLAAVAARWRAATEAAIAEGEWGVARMALGRWLKVAPNDAIAEQARITIERLSAPQPSPQSVTDRQQQTTTQTQQADTTVSGTSGPVSQGQTISPHIGGNGDTKSIRNPWMVWLIIGLFAFIVAGIGTILNVIRNWGNTPIVSTATSFSAPTSAGTSVVAASSVAPTVAPSVVPTNALAVAGSAMPRVLRINVGSEPDNWDPQRASFVGEIQWIMLNYQALMTFDKQMKPIPGQAESAESSQDGKIYTFKLRPNAKYSDGSSLTAKNFEYAWKRLADPTVAGEYQFIGCGVIEGYSEYAVTTCADAQGNTKTITEAKELDLDKLRDGVGVKAIDDNTLEIKLVTPAPYFLSMAALWIGVPVRQQDADKGDDWFRDVANYVGNGPFKMALPQVA